MRRAAIIVAAVVLMATHLGAQKDKSEQKDGSTELTLQVLNAADKQPIPDAHVVVRFTEPRMLRRDKRVSWEAKTNRKGIIVFPDVPTGTIKVQVIAKGFQTYGDEHALEKPQEEVTVLLEPPKGQVSAY